LAGIDLTQLLIGFAVLVGSLSFHEAAHAWTADRLGDPTARQLGRVSLNPMVHVDPIGTILFPLIAIVTNVPLIGWAKPVPVNARNLRQPRRDFTVVAAAGPLSNLLLAAAGALIWRVAGPAIVTGHTLATVGPLAMLIIRAVEINVLLAVFNLIPVPPLDGGNVLAGLLPYRFVPTFNRLRPWGFIILYVLMLSGILGIVVWPVAESILSWLL